MPVISQIIITTSHGETAIVTPRRNALRIIARRNVTDQTLRITVPYGLPLRQARDAIERLAERLRKLPTPHTPTPFHDGMAITCPDITFRITRQNFRPAAVTLRKNGTDIDISVGSALAMESPTTTAAINRALVTAAHHAAQRLLLPRAQAVAHSLGLKPAGWNIGRGKRTLGTCHSDRTITLSCLLVFLPIHLRDYIVCHELAHLTEMNHSERFHRLCDSYCQGREKELRKQLKNHKWVILG